MSESTPPTFLIAAGRKLRPMELISKNSRDKLVMKFTIIDPENPKHSGKRVTLQLRTANPVLAREKRDAVLEFAAKAGVTTRNISIVFENDDVRQSEGFQIE